MQPRLTFDLETYLIEPGQIIPKPVAGGMQFCKEDGTIQGPYLVTMDTVASELKNAINHGWLIAGHRVVYDLACAWRHDNTLGEYIWYALEKGLVSCAAVREKLIKCAEGRLDFDPHHFKGPPGFSMADLAAEYLGLNIYEAKNNPTSWRLRYRELDGVPFEQWPEEAKTYLLNDVKITDAIWVRQAADRATHDGIQFVKDGRVTNEVEQVRADWVLQLITAWGLITDKVAVDKLELELLTESTKYIEELKQVGLVKGDGSRNAKAIREAVERAFLSQGLQVPRTDPSPKFPAGQVKYDGDTLAECKDPVLVKLDEYNSTQKLLDTFVRPVLKQGTNGTIHPNYDVLKATGRTSSYGTGRGADKVGCNIQQLPRKGGVRECFIPRPGYVFIDCDYSTIELAALAQVTYKWFGYSSMRDALIRGEDLHLGMAANILGITYAQAVERYHADDEQLIEMRQLAKVPNFGFPGGMGAESLVSFAKSTYDMEINLPQAQKLKEVWFQTWPEMRQYFSYFASATNNPSGEFTLIQPMSQRVRGKCYYTSGANSCFQGLAGDGAKNALWLLSQEMYLYNNAVMPHEQSPLYGTRMVAFVHDQVLAETPEQGAGRAAYRLSQVMVAGMRAYLPDVPVVAEAKLMRRWYKKAKAVRNAQNELICWEPSGA